MSNFPSINEQIQKLVDFYSAEGGYEPVVLALQSLQSLYTQPVPSYDPSKMTKDAEYVLKEMKEAVQILTDRTETLQKTTLAAQEAIGAIAALEIRVHKLEHP